MAPSLPARHVVCSGRVCANPAPNDQDSLTSASLLAAMSFARSFGLTIWADETKEAAAMSQPDQLPRIGAPATRALASIDVTRLSQLTEHRADDLLKLHGMGPRAVGILRQALAEQGLSLRDEA
jgi:hypothetical protein